MEINHILHLIRRQCELFCLESITHYAQLLTFLPTGSLVPISVRSVIDKMSCLIKNADISPQLDYKFSGGLSSPMLEERLERLLLTYLLQWWAICVDQRSIFTLSNAFCWMSSAQKTGPLISRKCRKKVVCVSALWDNKTYDKYFHWIIRYKQITFIQQICISLFSKEKRG